MESPSRVSLGSRVEFLIHVPDLESPLWIDEARIQWSRDGKFGVEFVRVLPTEQERLSQVLKELADHGRS